MFETAGCADAAQHPAVDDSVEPRVVEMHSGAVAAALRTSRLQPQRPSSGQRLFRMPAWLSAMGR
jgi:hypothetical protein